MKQIKREDMPKVCPDCNAELKSYHGPNSITRRVCIKKCNGYKEIVVIDHTAETRGLPNAILLNT